MDKITVEQVQANREAISKLHDEGEAARKGWQDKRQEVDREYRDKIWELEQAKREELNSLEDKQSSVTAHYDQRIAEQYQTIEKAKCILECLSLDPNRDLSIADDEIEISRYAKEYTESLGYLFDDDYLKIKVFIVGNRKPKNCYSLIAIGKSLFTEELIKYRHDYGIDIITSYRGFSLIVSIKDMATTAELKDYYNKHKGKMLTETIEEYQQAKTEYLEAINHYAVDGFRDLITWRCPKCKNFQTTFDSDPAFGKPPQCYRHDPYIEMVKTGVKVMS